MSGRLATCWRWLRRLVLLALVVWAGWAWWLLGPARPSGERLAIPSPPTASQRQAAQRFFAGNPELRKRFLAATAAAQSAEEEGAQSDALRATLARAFHAAARRDPATLQAELNEVEQALTQSPAPLAGQADSREAFVELLGRFGPGFDVARTLAMEGNVAPHKLLARARRHAAEHDYGQASGIIQLAARLLALEPASTANAHVPTWFDGLELVPPKSIGAAQARAAVELCQAMTAAEKPSTAVEELVGRARRELKAERWPDAFGWAGVALSALGMSDQAIDALAKESAGPSQ